MSAALTLLDGKIAEQTAYLEQWRKPSEPLLFETLRAIDWVFCDELFVVDETRKHSEKLYRALLAWGVNNALARLLPDQLSHGAFKLFPSKADTQEQTEWFLMQCGILAKAERLRGWLAEGLVTARLDKPPEGSELVKHILVLKTAHPSLFQETVAITQRRRISDFVRESDQAWESGLQRQHVEMMPELVRRVEEFGDWGMAYSTTPELDRYFLECGQVYLRRMWSQDLIGTDEKIGGNQFNEYLGVLAALSGRAQKHLCYASIMAGRCPEIDLRNLLTTYYSYDEFLVALAKFLDADVLHVQKTACQPYVGTVEQGYPP